jgi:hypothetical protein
VVLDQAGVRKFFIKYETENISGSEGHMVPVPTTLIAALIGGRKQMNIIGLFNNTLFTKRGNKPDLICES